MKIRNQQSQVMLFAMIINLFVSFAAAGIRGINAGYGYAAMGLSEDFISGANHILHELLNESSSIINTKTSQYNNNVFMDIIIECNKIYLCLHM